MIVHRNFMFHYWNV